MEVLGKRDSMQLKRGQTSAKATYGCVTHTRTYVAQSGCALAFENGKYTSV